jgi:hypothetical protein
VGRRTRRAEEGNDQRIAADSERLCREGRGGDEESGLALSKLGDDAELVVAAWEGRVGFAGRVVVTGGASRSREGRVRGGVLAGVEPGVPLRAIGKDRQQEH